MQEHVGQLLKEYEYYVLLMNGQEDIVKDYDERSTLEVKLIFKDFKQHRPSLTYCETLTYAATVDLFLKGIHTVQMSATRIGFESERDRMLGLLYLAGREEYTPVYAELCEPH